MSGHVLRVFISATTDDLGSSRIVVRDALLEYGILPILQDHFPPDFRSLQDYLRDQIAECEVCICLVGSVLGSAPTDQAVTPRSYTQIEYDIARQLNRPVFVFMTTDGFVPDRVITEPADAAEKQRRHRDALRSGHKCEWFPNKDKLNEIVHRAIPVIREAAGQLRMFFLHPPRAPAFFAGRVEELAQMTDAARNPTPSIIALLGTGGQGKTTLAHQWVTQTRGQKFAAGFWCTAYRGDFSFDMFLDEILLYLLKGKFDKREMEDVARRVTRVLTLVQERPTLIVIDGIERWLHGWQSGGWFQSQASELERRAACEGLDDFLEQMSGLSNGTHLLITTRALPVVLDNVASIIPVRDRNDPEIGLRGLDPDSALRLLRKLGVTGSDEQLLSASEEYAHHPLALEVLSGLLAEGYGGNITARPQVEANDKHTALFELFETTRRHLPGRKISEKFLTILSHCKEDPSLGVIEAGFGHEASDASAMGSLRERAAILARWNLIGWDGAHDKLTMHPQLRHFFAKRCTPHHTMIIHRRLSDWYFQRPTCDQPSSLKDIAPRSLAIEHSLQAASSQMKGSPWRRILEALSFSSSHRKQVSQSISQLFHPIRQNLDLVGWFSAWGHQQFGIDLVGRLAEFAQAPERARLFIIRAAYYRQLDQVTAALNDIESAITILSQPAARDQPEQIVELSGAYMNRGNIRQHQGLASALADYDRAYNLLESSGLSKTALGLTVQILLNRTNTLSLLGRWAEARRDCEYALATLEREGARSFPNRELLVADSHGRLANSLSDAGDYDGANEHFSKAIEILEKLISQEHAEHEPLLWQVQIMRGTFLMEGSNPQEAVSVFRTALSKLETAVFNGRNDLHWLLALGYMNLGQCLLRAQNWHQSLEASNRAVSLLASGSHLKRGWYAHSLANRSEAKYALKEVSSAIADHKKAFDLFRELIREERIRVQEVFLRKALSFIRWQLSESEAFITNLFVEAVDRLEQGILLGVAPHSLRREAQRALTEANDVIEAMSSRTETKKAVRCLRACANDGTIA